MSRRPRTLLVVGEIRGDVEGLARVLSGAADVADLVAVVGDLAASSSKADTYREIFRHLGESGLPSFWIPGPNDAPLQDYLREAHNMEVAFAHLRGVHGSIAEAPGQWLFAGMGGEILDDPNEIRGEDTLLRYPGWELEYRLKILNELKERQLIFLFTTPPAHKGLHEPGSEVVAELVNTYRPRLVIVGRKTGVAEMRIGKSLVVCPGRLDQGEYALIDLADLTVEAPSLASV